MLGRTGEGLWWSVRVGIQPASCLGICDLIFNVLVIALPLFNGQCLEEEGAWDVKGSSAHL